MEPLRRVDGRFVKAGATRACLPLPDVAIVTLVLTRETGEIEIIDDGSTPMETWAMLEWARKTVDDRLTQEAD